MGRSANFVFFGLLAVAAMLSACVHAPPPGAPAAQESRSDSTEQETKRVPNEYLVTLAPDVGDGVITEYFGRFGIKYLHALAEQTYLLIVGNDPGLRQMEDLIRDESRIRLIQPNLIYWGYR